MRLIAPILTIHIPRTSEANFATVFEFRGAGDALAIDKSAVAAAQIRNDVMAVGSRNLGVAFGNGRMLDYEIVVERASDENFAAIENAGQ